MTHQLPIVIGITGGIGSGKSTVAKMFEALGVPVFYADAEAKNIMHKDAAAVDKITTLFGSEAYTNGQLNASHIASKVFHDAALLAQLNAIVHPAVATYFDVWKKQQKSKFVMREAAILIETKGHLTSDEVFVVVAHQNTRIKRVMQRDGTTEDAILKRMKNQLSDDERMPHATWVFDNNNEKDLSKQVQNCWQYLTEKYKD